MAPKPKPPSPRRRIAAPPTRRKVGFIWFSMAGPCDGTWPSYRQSWMGSTTFYLETLKVFLGAYPTPPGGTLDLSVQLHHGRGDVIDVVSADRYQNSSGIADVCSSARTFLTPWEFKPGDELVVYPYGAGSRLANGEVIQWGIWIHAEGYVFSSGAFLLPEAHRCLAADLWAIRPLSRPAPEMAEATP